MTEDQEIKDITLTRKKIKKISSFADLNPNVSKYKQEMPNVTEMSRNPEVTFLHFYFSKSFPGRM